MLETTERAGIVRLVLNRPQKRNALTRDLLAQMLGRIRDAKARGGTRLLVLAAEGTVFCAGMDLFEMQQAADHPDAAEIWRQDAQLYRDLVGELFELPFPTLAVVQGPVLAGGLGLVLACDIVLASDAAAFSLPEPQRGLTAAIVTPLLIYRVGAGRAGYLLLSGENLDAKTAERMGIIHHLVPHGQLASVECNLRESILRGAPGALSNSKQHLQACGAGALREQLDRALTISAAARGTAEAREGRAAFLERRPPKWQCPAPDHGLYNHRGTESTETAEMA